MTNLTRRRTLQLAGAGALALAAPALAAKRKITVGALRFTSHSASFVALERGYFADAGLDVEFKFFQAAQPMAVAIDLLFVFFDVGVDLGFDRGREHLLRAVAQNLAEGVLR